MAVELGADSFALMQNAARSLALAVRAGFAKAKRIGVLAGPGNNGGDAMLAAAALRGEGLAVELFMAGPPRTQDAARALAQWGGKAAPLGDFRPGAFDLAIDGLFGAGLQRAIGGDEAAALQRLAASGVETVAIDLPSGVSGLTGQVLGTAAPAALTVTFFRRKPGHLLQPGKALCGRVMVADIGIPDEVLGRIAPRVYANEPGLWQSALLAPSPAQHKYTRGHAVVFSGGPSQSGAARLSAMAALRGGAGLVTLFAPGSALAVNAAHLTAIMLRRCDDAPGLAGHLADKRLNVFVLGPGFGIGEPARQYAGLVLAAGRALVLDADGISSFASHTADLFQLGAAAPGRLVMTPHAGEFARLFPDLGADHAGDKLAMARAAAARAQATIVLKGSDTVIAAPDGRAAINETGTPALATAGTGDVLTGIIAAQLANGLPPFEAACAGAWLHGVAARLHGPGLIAEDLPGLLPAALARLYALCGFELAVWPD